ncbi:hypothetical protein ABMA28_016460 [Loxostege sticticalis]|uniref:Uncharacterized protein n=1 Tax=Loxostege sticticalis TaxID=481309 RepID=A0ABD0TBZ0_LOXSC
MGINILVLRVPDNDINGGNPDSQVVGRQVGEMQYLQKSTRIPLKVPKCYKVTEVKVEIEDSVDTPTVTYDEGALTVTISFTQKQTGLAVYDIIIQGRKIVPRCYKVTVVKVEVEKPIDTPTVTYDEGTLTVNISYTQKQKGMTIYSRGDLEERHSLI